MYKYLGLCITVGFIKEGGRVSYSSVVCGTAIVTGQTRSMIFTTCAVYIAGVRSAQPQSCTVHIIGGASIVLYCSTVHAQYGAHKETRLK